MRAFLTFIAVLFVGTYGLTAQDKSGTKIEEFQSKSGTVLVRGMSDVGTVEGKYGGSLTVQARQITDAANPKIKVSGVRIELTTGGRSASSKAAFIDTDEIDGLLTGLNYLEKVTKGVTPLKSFEVEYKTKGDLGVVVFNSGTDDNISFAVRIGSIGQVLVFFEMNQIATISDLLLKAKTML